MTDRHGFPRFLPCGETAMTVELGDSIDLDVNRRVHRLFRALLDRRITGVHSLNPTYRSLFIQYDPLECSFERLVMIAEEALEGGDEREEAPAAIDIPVCYGGECGPDLGEVAACNGLTEDEVIRRHTARAYQVYMIGFTPGFPYLGGLDPALFTPRKPVPRKRVPAGSVGIAEQQTGIYPIESPGGWQLIGRTPLRLFDPNREPPFLVEAGATLRFHAITRDEFDRLDH